MRVLIFQIEKLLKCLVFKAKLKLKKYSINLKETLHNAFIKSSLQYTCVVWDPVAKSLIELLEKSPEHCARFLFKIYKPRHDM